MTSNSPILKFKRKNRDRRMFPNVNFPVRDQNSKKKIQNTLLAGFDNHGMSAPRHCVNCSGGRISCKQCFSKGKTQCETCLGNCRLKTFSMLTVKWQQFCDLISFDEYLQIIAFLKFVRNGIQYHFFQTRSPAFHHQISSSFFHVNNTNFTRHRKRRGFVIIAQCCCVVLCVNNILPQASGDFDLEAHTKL